MSILTQNKRDTMNQDMITLGFDRIIQQLTAQAVSQSAARRLAETEPILHEGRCKGELSPEEATQEKIMEKILS